MDEARVKQLVFYVRLLLSAALLCAAAGFLLCASSPERVYYGIAVIIAGMFIAPLATVPALKLKKLRGNPLEARVKKLEEEAEALKRR